MKTAVVAGAALMLLTACDNLQLAKLTAPETPAYDGVWVGQLTVLRRTAACRLTRTGIRARLEDGIINGVVRYEGKRGQLVGVLNEDGTVRRMVMAGAKSDFDDLTFEGSFGEREATGDWQHQDCNGEWTLRKAR